MSFSHPLARGAKVWTGRSHDGAEQSILVIVTTIELDPKTKKYKKKLVESLSSAAQQYLADVADASQFVLVNRFRDWGDVKD